MLGKKRKFRAPKITTVVGRGTEIVGDIRFAGGLHVDGRVQGDVTSVDDDRAALTLSDVGEVEGDIRVANVLLDGAVIGDVHAHRVELAPKAKITGTVYYQLLEMAMGAEVNGKLVHAPDAEPPRLAYDATLQQSEEEAPVEEAAKRRETVDNT